MARPMPGYLPPLAALAVTLLAGGLFALAAFGGESVPAILILPLLVAPPVVSAAWGVALVMGRPRRLTMAASALVVIAGMVALPGDNGWSMAGNIAAGLFAGFAIGRGWRMDRGLLGVALILLPALVWALTLMSPAEMFADLESQLLEIIEQGLPAGASDADRTRVMEDQARYLGEFVGRMLLVYPWMLGLGLLGQAGIILGLTGWGIRRLGVAWPGWGLPPFTRWRLPFYLVWVMVAGIVLYLSRISWLGTAGLNLALLAASVIALQGLAIQFWVTGRLMSPQGPLGRMGPPLQVAYWVIAGVFLALVILASSLVLGLADQWMDIRRLNETGVEGEGNSPEEDELD